MNRTEILQAVVSRTRQLWPDVLQVVLFGSQARDDARPDSDYDILIIVPETSEAARQRIIQSARLRLALRGLGVGFDLVVLSPAEFARLRGSEAWWSRAIVQDAVVLHEAA